MNHIVAKKSLINSIHQLYFDSRTIRSIIESAQTFRDSDQPISKHVYILRQISRAVIRMSWAKNAVLHHHSSLLPWPTLINLEQLDNETLEAYLTALRKDNNLDLLIEKLSRCVSYAEEQIAIQKQQYQVLAAISAHHEKISILTQGLKDSLEVAEKEQLKKITTSKQARKEEQQQGIIQTRKALQTLRDIHSHMAMLKQYTSNSETSGEVPKLALQLLAQLNSPTIFTLKLTVNPELIEDLVGSLLQLLNSSNYLNSTSFQDSWLDPLIVKMKRVLALPRSKVVEAFFAEQQEFDDVNLFINSSDTRKIINQILHLAYKPLETFVKDKANFSAVHQDQLLNSLKLLQLFIKEFKPTTSAEPDLRDRARFFSDSILSIVEGNWSHASLAVKEIHDFFVSNEAKDSKTDKEKTREDDSSSTAPNWDKLYLSDVAMLKHHIKDCIHLPYSTLSKHRSTLSNAEKMYNRYEGASLSMDKKAVLDKLFKSFTEINLVITTLQKSTLPEPLFFDIITLVNGGLINNASVDGNGDIRIDGQIASLKSITTYVANRAHWIKDYNASLARKIQKASKDESIPDITLKELHAVIQKSKDDLAEAQKKAAAILEGDAAPEQHVPGYFVVLKEDMLLSTIQALTPILLVWKARLCNPIDVDGNPPEEILKRAYHKELIELALQLINQVCFAGELEGHDDFVAIYRLAILRVTSVLGEIFHEMRGAPYYSNEPDIQKVSDWRNILQHFSVFKNGTEILLSYVKNGSVKRHESVQAAATDAGIDGCDDNPATSIETVLTVLQHDIFNKDKFQSLSDESARLLGLAREYMLTFAGGDLIRDLKLSPRFLEFNTLYIHTKNKMGILSATNIAAELQLTRNKYAHAPLISSMSKPNQDKALMLRMFELVKSVRGIEPVKSSDLDLVQNGVIPAMQLCWVILVLTNKDGSLRKDLESCIQKNMDQFARLLNIKLTEDGDADAWLLQVESRIHQLVTEYGDPSLKEVLNLAVAAENGADMGADSASAGVKRFGLFSLYCRNVYKERNDQWHQLQLPEVN